MGEIILTKEELRAAIDALDLEMRTLFTARMDLVKALSAEKEKQGLPIVDSDRERALTSMLKEEVCDEYRTAYSSFLFSVLSASKTVQAECRKEYLNILPYPVSVGNGLLKDVFDLFDLNRRVLVVTDDGVPETVVSFLCEKISRHVLIRLPCGEQKKSFDAAIMLLKMMADHAFDRYDCVVAVGGGTVCDLAGFAASVYMRGIDLYLVPTTLLAQADAAIGGKNALDFDGCKNTVGTFYQPKGVLVDPSLSDPDDLSGMAEIVKIFATSDKSAFERLEHNGLSKEEAVRLALECKARVVFYDEKEKDLRRVLNFGHTVGHAVEIVAGLTHGQAVGIGMLCMTSGNVHMRIKSLLERYGLPTEITVNKEKVLSVLKKDKKADNGVITVLRVDEIGSYRTETLTPEQIVETVGEGIVWQ